MTKISKRALLTSCITSALLCAQVSAKGQSDIEFDRYTLTSDYELSGHLFYLQRDLQPQHLLISSTKDQRTIINVFSDLDSDKANLANSIKLPSNSLFFNAGQLANKHTQSLLVMTADQLLSVDIASGNTELLTHIDSFYAPQASAEASFSEFAKDLNGDGLVDVLTANFNKVNVYLQQSDGKFSAQSIDFTPEHSIKDRSITISEPESFSIDINGDDRLDLAFLQGDQLVAFTQLAKGGFAAEPVMVPFNAGILTKQDYRHIQRDDDATTALTTLEQLIDLDGDKLVDLVTKTTSKGGMFGGESAYQIRFGQRESQGLYFAKKPDLTLTPKGQTQLEFNDLNNDGLVDYSMFSLELGVGSMMSLVSGSLDADIFVHRMHTKRQFSEKPDYDTEIEVLVNTDTGRGGRTAFELADFDGDGLKDLFIQSDDDEFRIHKGEQQRLFAKKKSKYTSLLPKNGSLIETNDFNHDGKADILIRFEKQDGEQQAKSLALWLSKSPAQNDALTSVQSAE